MAIALEKLEDQLKCSICLDTYIDPKQLQCHHVYCQRCLYRLVVRDQQGQLSLTCPNCRQVTPVPASGVADLQAAFRVNQLLEIVEEHKKATASAPSTASTASPEKVESARNNTACCPEHDGRELELYCETCLEMICYKCIKKGEKHHSHHYEELNEAFERYKGEITSLLEPVEKQLTTIEAALVRLDSQCGKISDQRESIEANIHTTITRLHKMLDARKTELIGQLHRLTLAKLESLAAQREKIEITQAQLSSCLHFMRENLKGNQRDSLPMKNTTVLRQVKELTNTFQPDMLVPNTEADMIFSVLADLSAECQSYGKLYATGSPDPSKCCTTGKGSDTAEVGKKSTIIFQAMNWDAQPCKGLITISCELLSEITGTIARGSAKRKGQSQYEISYRPTIKGRHQLHVKVEGQQVRGSPFPVTARLPVEKLGTPILTIKGIERPDGVAVNQKGEILVVREGCVITFSPSGKKLQSFDTLMYSLGRGYFAMTLDDKDNVLVADQVNHFIRKFTAEGKCLNVVNRRGSGPSQFLNPYGIAFNASNGKMYVTDSGNCRVQILNSDLSHCGTFGKRGSGKGQFAYPQHIACDNLGNVYVADSANHCVHVFTAKGKFLRTFGRRGEHRGELNRPYGVAVDSSGRVYVSECGSDCISVFSSEGEFVTSFGGLGKGPGELDRPHGLAVDSIGVVYVCDWYNNRVQLF